MEEIKISIIIPVYNAAGCIRQCLDSAINQTFREIEIICVDDGSIDNSLDILKEYQLKDSRIKVFAQENKGPSSARNLGLDNANGEYITFVDADDTVSLEMCEKIYQKALSTSADIVVFSNYHVANNIITKDDRINKIINNAGDVFYFEDEANNFVLDIPVETWGKLYKSDFLRSINVKFANNIIITEDMTFFFEICLYNPKIVLMQEPYYYYVINTVGSLSKRSDIVRSLFRTYAYLNDKCVKIQIKNKKEILHLFIQRVTNAITCFWNSCYTINSQKENFKYLKYLYNYYKELPHKNDKIYEKLKSTISDYRLLFWAKLFEPFIEINVRSIRVAVYLFGKQILNIPKTNFTSFYYNIFYSITLWKLRFVSKFRKVRVGFWVTEPAKWASQHFYDELKNDKHFEPFILLSYFARPQGNILPKDFYNNSKKFFEEKGAKVIGTFNPDNYTFEDLNSFKPDIIFYQQPWLIDKEQYLDKTHKQSLICYIPYCFYSMNSYLNYLARFQNVVWKYFVESDEHKKEYIENYEAKNCVVTGSTKLDEYHFINSENVKKYKKDGKKLIIYAPHHSFNDGLNEVATFKENGKFILELAKKHPEFDWIFRPHPMFIDRIIKNSIMTLEEVNQYYEEWGKIGIISTDDNYYEMFAASDLLITDCISFLTEYAPTLKPVFHLRKKYQKESFNTLVSKVIDSYYQIYSNEEFEKLFNRVVVENDDYLAEKRQKNKELLYADEPACKNIYNYIKKELWL